MPTAAEGGLPAFDAAPFYAIFAPKGTPQPIVDRLADALNKSLNEDLARKRLLDLGAEVPEPNRRGPKPLGALVKSRSRASHRSFRRQARSRREPVRWSRFRSECQRRLRVRRLPSQLGIEYDPEPPFELGAS